MDFSHLITIGIVAIVLGILMLVAGAILSSKSTEVRGGGVVFLGPIPLIFGTDRASAVFVSILAIVMMILVYLFFRR